MCRLFASYLHIDDFSMSLNLQRKIEESRRSRRPLHLHLHAMTFQVIKFAHNEVTYNEVWTTFHDKLKAYNDVCTAYS